MSAVIGAGGVTPLNIQGMDLETALLAVQSQRANLLEQQLKSQIDAVQARNDQIAKLNDLLGQVNQAMAQFPAGAAGDVTVGKTTGITQAMKEGINSAIINAGLTDYNGKQQYVTLSPPLSTSSGNCPSSTKNSSNALVYVSGGMADPVNKGQLEGFVQKLKGQIDSLGNSQQMDMLRLQSLTNKRNEAFETMTNFIKKMQDARSSIIGNMR